MENKVTEIMIEHKTEDKIEHKTDRKKEIGMGQVVLICKDCFIVA